jgi:hypothetical protein
LLGVIQSIVTPFGASLLCQPRCGMRTRSPAHRRQVVAPCGSSTVDSVSPARTWSSSSALWSSQGGRPEKLVTPHVQPWNRMCRSRLAVLRSHWQVSAYHSLHGLRAQIVEHPVWFLLCRRRHLLIEKIAVAGEKLRSSRPKNFACPRVKFRRPPGENDHKPVGITNPGSGPNIER